MFAQLFEKIFGRKKRPPSLAVTVLVAGLGNPGEQYADTRHNVGFRVIDGLDHKLEQKNRVSCAHAEVTTGILSGKNVVLVKPLTFMNKSGDAIGQLAQHFAIGSANCIVIVDDVNLKPGTLRIRKSGSDGGHNGLKSLIGALGADFPRIRVGVGMPPKGVGMIDHVLGSFSAEEAPVINMSIEKAVAAVQDILAGSLDAAMNEYNKS